MPPIRRNPGGRFRLLRMAPLLLLLVLAVASSHSTGRRAHSSHTRPAATPTGYRTVASEQELVASTASGTPSGPLVHVSVSPTAKGAKLPASFLGLSIESWHLQELDSDQPALERILSRLNVPGDGGLMLRVGGSSTEQTYWDSPSLGTNVPAFRPTQAWVDSLNAVTRADHLRLLLELNLAANSPSMARRYARAMAKTLPRGSIADFEVGNEPDIGHREAAYPAGTPRPATPSGWDHYTSASYDSRFRAYAAAVAKATPRIRLAGPEVFFPGRDVSWLSNLMAAQRSHVGMLSVHRYPLSSCGKPTWHDYATVPRLLNSATSTGLANSMVPAVRVARQYHVPMRLTEVNSVTCGGSKGVSDSFATALWAADTLFSMWRDGVSGVNIHNQPRSPNAAFTVSSSGLVAHPLLYGMLMWARSVGRGAQLVGTQTSGTSNTALKIWAVRTSGRLLKVLVLNKGANPARVAMNLPATTAGWVQRLTSSGAAATTGETLDGQTVGPQGQLLGRRTFEPVKRVGGNYTVPVGAYSAVLVTVHTS